MTDDFTIEKDYGWEWMRDVKNQYVFHKRYDNTTHQIEFDKILYCKTWIRKRKIMRILEEGSVKVRYSVFGKQYLTALYSVEKHIEIEKVKILFGHKVYNKILSLS
jgi:hypothetical protein